MNKIVERKNKDSEKVDFVSFIIKINRLTGTYLNKFDFEMTYIYIHYFTLFNQWHTKFYGSINLDF